MGLLSHSLSLAALPDVRGGRRGYQACTSPRHVPTGVDTQALAAHLTLPGLVPKPSLHPHPQGKPGQLASPAQQSGIFWGAWSGVGVVARYEEWRALLGLFNGPACTLGHPMCPRGCDKSARMCKSEKNLRTVCQLEGDDVYHVLSGLEGRVEGWGAGMSLQTPCVGQPGKQKSDTGPGSVSKQVGVSGTTLCG